MKKSSVFGTPVHSNNANLGQGFLPPGARPPRTDGTTTLPQFKGDQSQQPNPRSGTPLQSGSVNDDMQKSRPVDRNGGNFLNDAEALNGVVFGGVARSRDLIPPPAAAMDSPVPANAQRPNTDSVAKINALKSGKGDAFPADKTIPDGLVGTGGTMDR